MTETKMARADRARARIQQAESQLEAGKERLSDVVFAGFSERLADMKAKDLNSLNSKDLKAFLKTLSLFETDVATAIQDAGDKPRRDLRPPAFWWQKDREQHQHALAKVRRSRELFEENGKTDQARDRNPRIYLPEVDIASLSHEDPIGFDAVLADCEGMLLEFGINTPKNNAIALHNLVKAATDDTLIELLREKADENEEDLRKKVEALRKMTVKDFSRQSSDMTHRWIESLGGEVPSIKRSSNGAGFVLPTPAQKESPMAEDIPEANELRLQITNLADELKRTKADHAQQLAGLSAQFTALQQRLDTEPPLQAMVDAAVVRAVQTEGDKIVRGLADAVDAAATKAVADTGHGAQIDELKQRMDQYVLDVAGLQRQVAAHEQQLPPVQQAQPQPTGWRAVWSKVCRWTDVSLGAFCVLAISAFAWGLWVQFNESEKTPSTKATTTDQQQDVGVAKLYIPFAGESEQP